MRCPALLHRAYLDQLDLIGHELCRDGKLRPGGYGVKAVIGMDISFQVSHRRPGQRRCIARLQPHIQDAAVLLREGKFLSEVPGGRQ